MPRPRTFKKQDPYAALDEEFKNAAAMSDEQQLRDKIAQVTLNQAAFDDAKEKDVDFQQKKDAFSNAGAVYREARKMNRLRTKYLRSILDAKGKPTGDSGLDPVKNAVKDLKASLPAGTTLTVSAGGKTATIEN